MKGVRKELVAATTRAAIFWEGSSVIVGEGMKEGELRVWRLSGGDRLILGGWMTAKISEETKSLFIVGL